MAHHQRYVADTDPTTATETEESDVEAVRHAMAELDASREFLI